MLNTQPHDVPNVTLVDDEHHVQDVLVRAAQRWSYHCQTATSAEEAIELLEQHLTPVVVTDLRMPGQGGIWLVQEIRRRWPEVGIVVLTAVNDHDAAEACLLAGAHHFFQKPIKIEEFHHVLETATRRYQLQRCEEQTRAQLEVAVQRQTRRVRRTFLSAIDSLVRIIEERDPYTAGHSARVRRYALALGKALHLSNHLLRKLSLAAKLHDIGKLAVPEAILHKPSRLTPEEFEVVRTHPVVAERILAPIIRDPLVMSGIRGHHERLDGTGYPDHLQGEAVPLLARLIAIPDVFDSLTSARAYRRAMPLEEGLTILQAGEGTHFDPKLLQAFTKIAPNLLRERLSAETPI